MALDLDDDGVVDPDFLRIFEKTDPHRYALRRAKRLQMLGSLSLVDGNHDKKVTIKEFTQYFSGKTGIKKNFEICKGKGGGGGESPALPSNVEPTSNSSWEEHTIEKVDQFLIIVLVASFIVMQLCMYSTRRRKDDKPPIKAPPTKQSKTTKKEKKKEDTKKGPEQKNPTDAKTDAALREQQKREQRERDLAKKREMQLQKELEDNLKKEEKAKQKKINEEKKAKLEEDRKRQLVQDQKAKALADKAAAEAKAVEAEAKLVRDKKKEERRLKQKDIEQLRLAEETAASLIAEQKRLEESIRKERARQLVSDSVAAGGAGIPANVENAWRKQTPKATPASAAKGKNGKGANGATLPVPSPRPSRDSRDQPRLSAGGTPQQDVRSRQGSQDARHSRRSSQSSTQSGPASARDSNPEVVPGSMKEMLRKHSEQRRQSESTHADSLLTPGTQQGGWQPVSASGSASPMEPAMPAWLNETPLPGSLHLFPYMDI